MFTGEILFLDRDDINTDEIIPARYLNEISKGDLKPHLFEDLDLPGCSEEKLTSSGAVVTRSNFGCGSSREHAAWALQVNSIRMVISSGFARIFRQNMYNCGLLPVELGKEQIDELFTLFSGGKAEAAADMDGPTLTVAGSGVEKDYGFELSDFHRDLIRSGGWVEYAAERF